MREILFRGKRIDNGEWLEGNIIINHDFIAIMSYSGCQYWHDIIEVNSSTVGQFTGLTDKKGVRIFDGDILVDNPDNKVCNMFEIAWFDSLAGFMLDDGIIAYNTIGFLETPESNKMLLEVIGNIHDNPELMEVSGNENNQPHRGPVL